MLDHRNICELTKKRYAMRKYGSLAGLGRITLSREVESLAEVLVDAINKELARGRPA